MTNRRITTLALIGGLLLGTDSTAMAATAATKTTTAPAKTARKKAATTTQAAPAKTAASPTSTSTPAAVESTATNAVPAPPSAPPAETGDGDDMTMPGGQEGRVFRSLTIEGEDRVHLEFERPTLAPDLDPHKAPGLDPAGAADVLLRSGPDLVRPFTALSSQDRCPWTARPWLERFAHGPVARFRPDVSDVDRWRLVIANARGETVATLEGKGTPPKEIAWDGRAKDGSTVTPELTYSYVFEAHDKAGNKRNFVGPGFKVSAYRTEGKDGPMLAFAAHELAWPEVDAGRGGTRQATPPILLEAATWLNQAPRTERPIRVTATARRHEQAQALASDVARLLAPHVVGDPARVRGEAVVQADAPEGGTIAIRY
jgi:hypothetical protein